MGSEIACSERTLGVIIDQLESGYLLPLGTSNYILLELIRMLRELEFLRCVKQDNRAPEFGGKMYKPVIAHIERYHCFQKNPALLKTLKAWNVPMQINAYSLVEEKNESTKELARMLLKNKLVTFVGSDAHRTTRQATEYQERSETNGNYELLDGQQRTISICQYVNGDFSLDHLAFHNLTDTEREQILAYKLMIYICEGTDKEKLDWFKIINIAGEQLTAQGTPQCDLHR